MHTCGVGKKNGNSTIFLLTNYTDWVIFLKEGEIWVTIISVAFCNEDLGLIKGFWGSFLLKVEATLKGYVA